MHTRVQLPSVSTFFRLSIDLNHLFPLLHLSFGRERETPSFQRLQALTGMGVNGVFSLQHYRGPPIKAVVCQMKYDRLIEGSRLIISRL